MALYNVEVRETLSRVVEQEADSFEDAKEMVATRYLDSEIVLDWEDLESVEYDEYPSPKIQEGFNVNIEFNINTKELSFSDEYELIATYDCKTLEDLNNALKSYFKDALELESDEIEKDVQL